MSADQHLLTVKASDCAAEITVYDGSFKRVGRGVGTYSEALADGLYEVRIRTAGVLQSQLVSLFEATTLTIPPAEFESTVPLTGTSTMDDAHQRAVDHAIRNPVPLDGSGSALLISVRDLSRTRGSDSPARGLTLHSAAGDIVFDFDAQSQPDESGRTPIVAICLTVAPGSYMLRATDPDGGARERSLITTQGWMTQCFLARPQGKSEAKALADISQGSVSLTRLGSPYAPGDSLARLREVALDALTNYRQITPVLATAFAEAKFDDPVLGLLVGHLLLRDHSKSRLLPKVVTSLFKLLGADHPDFQALVIATSRKDFRGIRIERMPMLRASWDAIVEGSVAVDSLVPPDSPVAEVSTRVLASLPWLVWEASDDLPSRRIASKLAALRGYFFDMARSAGLDRVRATTTSDMPYEAPRTLDGPDKRDLAKSLGVPGSVLSGLISKLRE